MTDHIKNISAILGARYSGEEVFNNCMYFTFNHIHAFSITNHVECCPDEAWGIEAFVEMREVDPACYMAILKYAAEYKIPVEVKNQFGEAI